MSTSILRLHDLPVASAALLLAFLLATSAKAQDEPIELADDPFEISDPIAAAPGSAEAAFVGIYERARSGRIRDTIDGETELEFGVAPRLELRLGQSGAYGDLETRRRLGAVGDLGGGIGGIGRNERAQGGGTSRIGAMYQFTEDRGAAPAVALLGRLRTLMDPVGRATRQRPCCWSAKQSRAGSFRSASTSMLAGPRGLFPSRGNGRTATS